MKKKTPDAKSHVSKGSTSKGSATQGSTIRGSATKSPSVIRQSDASAPPKMHWSREGIESIVVAVMLALLFRTFEAEAFVIPTGSMAPTLQGRHKDIACEACGYQYRAGASQEGVRRVVEVNCPLCRDPQEIDPRVANQMTFNGDRILVNKFAYQFGDPQRWDVIVFKYPGNAKQNYIKRLVGLPGETLRIWHGDVYARPEGSDQFTILRRDPSKLTAMLQTISDTDRVPPAMIEAEWPQAWSETAGSGNWETAKDRKTYTLKSSKEESWLRYRQILPSASDWNFLQRDQLPRDIQRRQGRLVSDYYGYNTSFYLPAHARLTREGLLAIRNGQGALTQGENWVGDLAIQCDANVRSDTGILALDLVEAGVHHRCRIDIKTGLATMTLEGDARFESVEGATPTELTAQTSVRGSGKYRLRLCNADDQVRLWVGRRCVEWQAGNRSHPGHIETLATRPVYSDQDPGDLAPVGVGGQEIELQVTRLQVLRDIYYIAAKSESDGLRSRSSDYRVPLTTGEIEQVFNDPSLWATTKLFSSRNEQIFQLSAFPDDPSRDQYFPMGDNNPQSKDARLWTQQDEKSAYNGKFVEIDHYVAREMLIGKAFLVYWPHGWNLGNMRLAIIPNVKRMGRIR